MKALVFESYGKAEDVLRLQDIPEPEPGPGEVKVRMLYSPMNPSDLINTIEGTYRNAVGKAIWNFGKPEDSYSMDPDGERMLPGLPHIPGLEGVGIVVKAGSGLFPKWLMNKRVAVVGGKKGNWQEYNVVDARQALPVNKGVSDQQAAVSFVNPVTAYIMIREILKPEPGAWVLQSAGNSELGKMIIRMGRRFGFKTINIIRNASQAAHLTSIGADALIDVSSENLKSRVHEITQGRGVRLALDPIGGILGSEMIQCLGLGGKLLIYGTLSADPLEFSGRDLMTPLSSVEGFFLANYMAKCSLLKKLSITRKTASLVKSGELASDIRQVFNLEDFREAIAEVRKPNNTGKVLLRVSSEE